jgi:hypothetical protein
VFEKGEIRKTSQFARARALRVLEHRRVDFRDAVTSCCVRQSTLYVGLGNGQVIAMAVAGTGKSDIHSVRHLKHAVAKLYGGENNSVVVVDEKGVCTV